jgi:hypothetical protein
MILGTESRVIMPELDNFEPTAGETSSYPSSTTGTTSPSEAIALPEDFPESLPPFSFKLGDRVRWKPMPSTDWGTIAGIEYSWHSPGKSWQPRYKVHLDSDSPSRAWIVEDWAWEWDLEMLEATLR